MFWMFAALIAMIFVIGSAVFNALYTERAKRIGEYCLEFAVEVIFGIFAAWASAVTWKRWWYQDLLEVAGTCGVLVGEIIGVLLLAASFIVGTGTLILFLR